jgi:hypothetical protein
MRHSSWAISLLVSAGIIGTGCEKKHLNFSPPPLPQPQQTSVPAPQELPEPPAIQPEPGQSVMPVPSQPPEVPPPPAAPSPQPRPRRNSTDTRVQPPAAEVPAPAQPSEPLRLGTLTTPEQERDLNVQIDQSLNNAEANLRALQNRALTKDQEGAVAQVRNFLRQAREMRNSDLAGARSLARRGEILAGDLAASLR